MKLSGLFVTVLLVFFVTVPGRGELFVGLETSPDVTTYYTDMTGFPTVTWTAGYAFDVSGATATPDDTLYICNGGFNTDLYKATLTSSPVFIAETTEDMQSLAFGRDTLWGFSNYASPMGIYSIDIGDSTPGTATLAISTESEGYRFFGLGYNAVDDMLYGYTEYGASGLYSINIDTGEMIKIADPIPASNSQGRGLAVGNNTVYITATRGDDGIPYFAYDLSQGVGGTWVEFDNPYPGHHSTGGAAWLGDSLGVVESEEQAVENGLQLSVSPNPARGAITFSLGAPCSGTELSIYDASGRLQHTFSGSELQQSNSLSWNPDLPAGIYVAVLQSAEETTLQRFVLLK